MTVYSILIELYSITFINFPSFNLGVRIIFGDFGPLCYLPSLYQVKIWRKKTRHAPSYTALSVDLFLLSIFTILYIYLLPCIVMFLLQRYKNCTMYPWPARKIVHTFLFRFFHEVWYWIGTETFISCRTFLMQTIKCRMSSGNKWPEKYNNLIEIWTNM